MKAFKTIEEAARFISKHNESSSHKEKRHQRGCNVWHGMRLRIPQRGVSRRPVRLRPLQCLLPHQKRKRAFNAARMASGQRRLFNCRLNPQRLSYLTTPGKSLKQQPTKTKHDESK